MSIHTFLQKLAAMETGDELSGHMSGADAVGWLSDAIIEARTLLAADRREFDADALQVLNTCRGLLVEAMDVHIYDEADPIPTDCGYLAGIRDAEAVLTSHGVKVDPYEPD